MMGASGVRPEGESVVSLQGSDLKLVAIGVVDDAPPDPLQPRLRDGIHLRWAFRPERGFPWYGYYLFRRDARKRRRVERCLTTQLRGLEPRSSESVRFSAGGWEITSDAPLEFVDALPSDGIVEVALFDRRYLRVGCSEVASLAVARIAFVGDGAGEVCVDFSERAPGVLPNPLVEDGVGFAVRDGSGELEPSSRIVAFGPVSGLDCRRELEIRLPCVARRVAVVVSHAARPGKVSAFDEEGNFLEGISIGRAQGVEHVISFRTVGVARLIAYAPQGETLLHRVCFSCRDQGREEEASITVTGLAGSTPVARRRAIGRPETVVEVPIAADELTALEFTPGPAVLIDVCFATVCGDAMRGWEEVPGFPYPMCLPVAHPDYPCPGRPATRSDAEDVAVGRVSYGDPDPWRGARFRELHESLERLVVDGPPPGGQEMADRTTAWTSVPPPTDSATSALTLNQSDLDVVLVGALNPAVAQMVGLYWLDETAQSGRKYDYLIVADHTGKFDGDAPTALKWVGSSSCEEFDEIDGYILHDRELGDAPAVRVPDNLRAYALPGTDFTSADGSRRAGQNNVGARWDLEAPDPALLQVSEPLLYHLWRASVGTAEPSEEVAADSHEPVTPDAPLLVSRSLATPDPDIERARDWPPFPLHAIDVGLADGWYSYRVCGVDVFGRHSPMGRPASWRQWAPAPEPEPWYYQHPPSNEEVHPFAVRVLDKIPPPPPTAVAAAILDPADPYVLRDAAHQAWLTTLSATERDSLIGLRVSWAWTQSHMDQAFDTAEFRVYLNAGSAPATPDPRDPTSWESRLFVVPFGDHVTESTDEAGRRVRVYELFIPPEGDTDRSGMPLVPTRADPIRYATVGVTAVDDKAHSADAPKWTGQRWGDRTGNEGRMSAPATVFRVLRTPPDPPAPPVDGERVFATRADYLGHSYFTYRWQPLPELHTHVFRALDDSVFRADWSARLRGERAALQATDLEYFPDPAADPRWGQSKREQVADELNQLATFSQSQAGEAMERYRTLSDDGLRVLAGLPGNEKAFRQLTIEPLDPADPAYLDRRGPDDNAGYTPDPQKRAYLDRLDGRSRNRYLYRAAYLDRAHNRSVLGIASAPVWLPNVVPPRTPFVTKVLGGDRSITLRWASGREPDLASYRVYRAETAEAGRALRLMTRVATRNEPAAPAARPKEQTWTDTDVPALRPRYYRVTAVDTEGNESASSRLLRAQAFDQTPPDPPVWVAAAWDTAWEAVELEWANAEADQRTLVLRFEAGAWTPVSGWLEAGTSRFVDRSASVGRDNRYRLKVRSAAGNVNTAFQERSIPQP